MGKALIRAFRDTKSFFGWNRKTVIHPILYGVGLIVYYLLYGEQGVIGEVWHFIAFGLIPVGVFILLLFLWNLMRAPVYIKFEKKMKPCLEILRITEQNVGQTGAGWSLEIRNNGIEPAKGCHGNLEDIEFETPQGGLSLARMPRARDLGWSGQLENASDYTIAGGQHAMLNLVNRDSAAPDKTITLAYRSTVQFRIEHKLPQNDPILLLINIISEGRVPLYAICLLDMKAIASNIYRAYSGRSPVTLLYHGEQRRSLREFNKEPNSPLTADMGGSQN